MFYISHDECVALCTFRKWDVDIERPYPVLPPEIFDSISFMVPSERDRLTLFCRVLVDIIPVSDTDECLLWVMHWQDWGDQTNYHLYYRLRQSYSNFDPLYKGPGHVFLKHEINDLMTFVELALLFGWDFHLLSDSGDWGAYHDDELMIIYSNEKVLMDTAKEALRRIDVNWRKHK